jgi:hypothetical protein
MSGDTVIVGAPWEDADGFYHAGSAYVFMRDAGGADAWEQVAKLTASDAGEKDEFGSAVAIEGGTVVVGAVGDLHPGLSGLGSAHIFMRDAGGANAWDQLTTITGSDIEAGDEFGASVAISGDSLVVGVAGSAGEKAYVFERDLGGDDSWGQAAKLTASDAGSKDDFGQSVAIDRDTVVVGAEFGDVWGLSAAGSAYVFLRDQGGPNAWGEAAKLGATTKTDSGFPWRSTTPSRSSGPTGTTTQASRTPAPSMSSNSSTPRSRSSPTASSRVTRRPGRHRCRDLTLGPVDRILERVAGSTSTLDQSSA